MKARTANNRFKKLFLFFPKAPKWLGQIKQQREVKNSSCFLSKEEASGEREFQPGGPFGIEGARYKCLK